MIRSLLTQVNDLPTLHSGIELARPCLRDLPATGGLATSEEKTRGTIAKAEEMAKLFM